MAEDQSKPYKDAIARLEHELKEFVSEHRTDMGKTKTMTLTFGEVGFRLSTSIAYPVGLVCAGLCLCIFVWRTLIVHKGDVLKPAADNA